jgi:hypothetical protein
LRTQTAALPKNRTSLCREASPVSFLSRRITTWPRCCALLVTPRMPA